MNNYILLAFIATLTVLATLLAGTASASPTRMGSGLAMDINGIHQTQHQLIEVRNRRDALYLAAWDKVKRVRANVKGLYGDDSTKYELVGGTRRSDR